ncbi:MAG TPA: penicillin-binding protein 2 [Chthonomonadales bacterium]|nr:penicillin-binding protein 2 [Chthonomonadales bacterium]
MFSVKVQSTSLVRIRVIAIVLAICCAGLITRLWYLQIVQGDALLRASETNRSRVIRWVAPRGIIEDATGRVLACNRYRLVVWAVPSQLLAKEAAPVRQRLAGLLGVTAADIESTIREKRIGDYEPVRVAEDVDMATATRVDEQQLSLPGVSVGAEPVRSYPDGSLLGHVLGYMGEINEEELRRKRAEGYRPGDFSGELGLERAYEAQLRGQDGGQRIEVDAHGRRRRELESSAPVPGARLTLTIRHDLQKVAYDELARWAARGNPGAAVVMDPRDGAVLALVSTPSFDPNLFASGISTGDWRRLHGDPRKPLINRAAGSATAPGSTFKMVTAAAGLETGKATRWTTEYCRGVIFLRRWPKRCHLRTGHGRVDLTESLAKSCDVYFYRLGQRLGPDRMAAYARRFGLGVRTGIDLPRVEIAGIVPDPALKRARLGQPWVGGDTVDYAIGQSMLTSTPLQMCRMTAAIGNGGSLLRPQLVRTITEHGADGSARVVHRLERIEDGHLRLSADHLAQIVRGMEAVMEPGGTAAGSAIPGLRVAGKTGTTQRLQGGRMVTDAWFVAYAPIENPRIAICVTVQAAGHGSVVAAPIARKILERFFGLDVPAPVRESNGE